LIRHDDFQKHISVHEKLNNTNSSNVHAPHQSSIASDNEYIHTIPSSPVASSEPATSSFPLSAPASHPTVPLSPAAIAPSSPPSALPSPSSASLLGQTRPSHPTVQLQSADLHKRKSDSMHETLNGKKQKYDTCTLCLRKMMKRNMLRHIRTMHGKKKSDVATLQAVLIDRLDAL
jgi:hypothetical protein